MSKVTDRIRKTINPDDKIDTPSGRSSFQADKYVPDGIELLVGKEFDKRCLLTWCMLERSVEWLRGKKEVLVGPSNARQPQGTLREFFKLCNYRNLRLANYAAAILVQADIAKFPESHNGVRIKLHPAWDARDDDEAGNGN